MKKLIIIFLVAFAAFAVRGQTTIPTMPKADTQQSYKVGATLTNAVVKYYTWFAPKDYPTTQVYTVRLTKLTGSHDVSVVLYGKVFGNSSWTQIASGTSGTISTTADVTLTNYVPNHYRYFKTEFTGTGTATTTITSQTLKLYLE